jgi:hypothetical protein
MDKIVYQLFIGKIVVLGFEKTMELMRSVKML